MITAWFVLAAVSPTPSPSPGFGPSNDNQAPGSGESVSAGLYAFLIILVLAAALALIVWAMNRSLKRARHNLGGSVLPRQESDKIPVKHDDR